ncbi:hypothetical protein RJ640_015769 [Escallonia rubra]|uniref:Transmembrane protein n=1 Tax=Escallonia rubra TaxID=112253 RepID=A0AA88QIE5_9ASTE|nr:hypothetical protein RJ640_015769 [Escallonia rubra]
MAVAISRRLTTGLLKPYPSSVLSSIFLREPRHHLNPNPTHPPNPSLKPSNFTTYLPQSLPCSKPINHFLIRSSIPNLQISSTYFLGKPNFLSSTDCQNPQKPVQNPSLNLSDFTTFAFHSPPFSKPFATNHIVVRSQSILSPQNPNSYFLGRPRFLSTSNPPSGGETETPQDPCQYPSPKPEFKHQEITGPTVERDLSPLGKETREELKTMTRSMYRLSNAFALLGLFQLGFGAWISYVTRSEPIFELTVQSVLAFAIPFALALLLRRSVKPMEFFMKMEEQGRLQILTVALQIAKNVNVFFLRVRGVAYLCMAGTSVVFLGSVFFQWTR